MLSAPSAVSSPTEIVVFALATVSVVAAEPELIVPPDKAMLSAVMVIAALFVWIAPEL